MSNIDRRGFLGLGLAGVGAATLGTGSAQASDEPLRLYDLAHLYDLDLADPAEARRAYDELHLVATLQGIVNRHRPRLYVHFITHNQLGDIDIDRYWLDEMQTRGGLLAGRGIVPVTGLDELVSEFRTDLRGAVVWDPAVPATSNVASTVAGAQDVVAIRYDPAEGSLYQRYVNGQGLRRLPATVRLVSSDGESLFTGHGQIPGTGRESTGSAKCDAYIWAVERYLRTGRSVPEFAYYLDSYWLRDPKGQLQQALLSNHDYLVARRGFIFDLLPWDDETPVDDRDQPLGTDQRTLEEILRVGHQRAGGQFMPVHGFVPWEYKYTSVPSAGGRQGPVATEWRFVQVVSAFNAYVDADAEHLDGMANASVFRHAPLRRRYQQRPRPTADDLRARGFLDTDGGVVPRRYVTLYVGDYDSAAWLYQTMPHLWDDPARGSVPLNWAFNPNLAARMPVAMDRARRTADSQDTFVAGDSGAGYINPGMLAEPRGFSGLPSGVDAWRQHCHPHYRQWDLTVTGFVIDGFAPAMDQATLEAYAEFSPDGFAAQKVEPLGLVDETPVVQMVGDLPRGTVAEGAVALRNFLAGDLSSPPLAPQFRSIRTILMPPSWHRDVVAEVQAQIPDAGVEVVDAHTFYALVRHYLLDQVIISPARAILAHDDPPALLVYATSHVREPVTVELSLELPAGWEATPSATEVSLDPGETARVAIEVTVPSDTPLGDYVLTAISSYDGTMRRTAFVASVVERSYAGAPQVEVALGTVNQPDGLEQVELPDGQTEADVVAGRDCRRPVAPPGVTSYVYLRVDDTFMFDEPDTAAYVTVEYFDEPGFAFGLNYDSTDPNAAFQGAYKNVAAIPTSGTNTWRSHTFELPDVRFANRENAGSDLRLYTSDDLCIGRVVISREAP